MLNGFSLEKNAYNFVYDFIPNVLVGETRTTLARKAGLRNE